MPVSSLCAGIAAAALDATVRSAMNPKRQCVPILAVPGSNATMEKSPKTRPVTMRSLTPSRWREENRQLTLPVGLAGRLANNLHAVAIITKYRADERLPLLRREALEAGRHDAQARTARFDGCGLERGELR